MLIKRVNYDQIIKSAYVKCQSWVMIYESIFLRKEEYLSIALAMVNRTVFIRQNTKVVYGSNETLGSAVWKNQFLIL